MSNFTDYSIKSCDQYLKLDIYLKTKCICPKTNQDNVFNSNFSQYQQIQTISGRFAITYPTLYPVPQTTFMYWGAFGFCSIFSRICRICTATVLSAPMGAIFQIDS